MTEGQRLDGTQPVSARRPCLDELARAKGLKPIESFKDLEAFALDVWDSDEDLEAFLADVRASRTTSWSDQGADRRTRLAVLCSVSATVAVRAEAERCVSRTRLIGVVSAREMTVLPRTARAVSVTAPCCS